MTPFFFFTLSHTHCVSLYLFIRTAPLKLKLSLSLCLSLSRTHTKMAKKWLFVSALLLGPNGLSFLFLLFSSAYLTCLLSFALNQKLTLEAWGSKLINWALTGHVCWNPRVSRVPNKHNIEVFAKQSLQSWSNKPEVHCTSSYIVMKSGAIGVPVANLREPPDKQLHFSCYQTVS